MKRIFLILLLVLGPRTALARNFAHFPTFRVLRSVKIAEPFSMAKGPGGLWVTGLDPSAVVGPKGHMKIPVWGRPTGLDWHNGLMWVADGINSRILVFNRLREQVRQIPAPAMITGLAFCHNNLYALLGFRGRIARIDPADGTIVSGFPSPMRKPVGLACYKDRYLFVGDRDDNHIFLVNPASGKVLFRLDSPASYPSGLCVRNDRLLVLDRASRRIFALDLNFGPGPYRTHPRKVRVKFLVKVLNSGPAVADQVDVFVAVPADYANQDISDVRAIGHWASIEKGEGPGRIAHFIFHNLKPGQVKEVGYTLNAVLYDTRWILMPGGLSSKIPARLSPFLADADKYMTHSAIIRNAVKHCCAGISDAVTKARAVLGYVTRTLHYALAGGWNPAPMVLSRGSGSCSEYTFSVIALARAAGLPARYVGSLVFRGHKAGFDDVFHRWSEVYLPGTGWVPADGNKADRKLPAEAATGFGELDNQVLITTWSAGPSRAFGWDYDYHVEAKCKGQCTVKNDAIVFFREAD